MRLARRQNAALVGFADIGIIEPVNRVGNRLRAAQNQLVEHFVAAAHFNHRHFGIVLALKLRQHIRRQAERFVHRQPHFGLRLRRQAQQQHGEGGKKALFHQTLPCILFIFALSYQAHPANHTHSKK